MNKKLSMIQRTSLYLMILSLLLSACLGNTSTTFAENRNGDSLVQRGQAAEMIAQAADDYNTGVAVSDIIKGYGNGELREHQIATKAEIAVMLDRGFGKFPKPQGDRLRMSSFDIVFSEVPVWAEDALEHLRQAGILANGPDGLLDVDQPMTVADLHNHIQRIWALYGSNAKDDFYATVNKQWLDSSEIPAGEASNGVLGIMQETTERRLESIIDELIYNQRSVDGKQYEQGTKEQKIVDFYSTASDQENRNQQGSEPIQMYLRAYENAENLQQLLQADMELYRQTGMATLMQFVIGADPKDSGSHIMYHGGLSASLDKHLYDAGQTEKTDAYLTYIAKLLTLAGEDAQTASKDAEKLFALEKDLAAVTLEPQEKYDINKTYNLYKTKNLHALYKHLPDELSVEKIITDMGFELPKNVLVMDKKLLEQSASYFTEENLPLLKIYAKVRLLSASAGLLSEDFRHAQEEFSHVFYGVEGKKTDKQRAVQATSGAFSDYIGQMYAERYFSPAAKKDVEQLVGKFIDVYRQRLTDLEWMSEKTKGKAIKKLETMAVKVGYPDQWTDVLETVAIVPYEDGGSYFANTAAISRATAEHNRQQQSKPVDREKWQIDVYEVNAYYNPLNNEIVFPAGILQQPFYDANAPLADNLGGIGVVIAHEISHAFDDNGSKYDQNGNANNWWTKSDSRHFLEKCQAIIAFYDGIEIIPGVFSNGELTLGENIADLGGIATALQVLKSDQQKADYRRFFEAYAKSWAATSTKEIVAYLSQTDVHSNKKIRVNRSIVNFDEFYEAFDIQQTDGMYVAPEHRVKLW